MITNARCGARLFRMGKSWVRW